MRYHPFYYRLFRGTMKKTLAEAYDRAYAAQLMKKSDCVYRRLVADVPDLGRGNPMAYNVLFALAFIAPYVASEKKIGTAIVREMMENSLYKIKWYFALVDLNTPRGKGTHHKLVNRYIRWYTPARALRYPTSFKMDRVGQPHPEACYYRITRCPICSYCEEIGVPEIMASLCELDALMISLQHGVLHRAHTIAAGGPYCDYYITGNKEAVPAREERP